MKGIETTIQKDFMIPHNLLGKESNNIKKKEKCKTLYFLNQIKSNKLKRKVNKELKIYLELQYKGQLLCKEFRKDKLIIGIEIQILITKI